MENKIIPQIKDAQANTQSANLLVEQYLPFIKSEVSKFLKRPVIEGHDDELGIAMFAFHNAVLSYSNTKGNFISYAATVIRNKLIDFQRATSKHNINLSIDLHDDEEYNPLHTSLSLSHDPVEKQNQLTATREELIEYSSNLKEYSLSLSDIADNCPKQQRTLDACIQVLNTAKNNPSIIDKLISTKKLSVTELSSLSKVPIKTIERHRKYIIALIIAYTNGYDIIRNHINQIDKRK